MINKCPRCGTYCYERAGVHLTEFKASLYDLIARRRGISSLELAAHFYGNQTRNAQAAIRQHILQINNLLVCTYVAIVGTRSYGYTITGLKHATPLRTDAGRSQAEDKPRA